jgi:hypothetical protein
MDQQIVAEIRECVSTGMLLQETADTLGLTYQQVKHIMNVNEIKCASLEYFPSRASIKKSCEAHLADLKREHTAPVDLPGGAGQLSWPHWPALRAIKTTPPSAPARMPHTVYRLANPHFGSVTMRRVAISLAPVRGLAA